MSFSNDSIDNVLQTLPVIAGVHSLVVACALPPLILLIFFLHRIALHSNCKFLLFAWLAAFSLSVLSHLLYAIAHMSSGKYIPTSADPPVLRPYALAAHGFAHAFSSVQELLFAIERTFACANPSRYHDRSLSLAPLLLAELAAIGLGSFYAMLLGEQKLIIGCYITTTIDLLSLMGLIVTKLWTDRRKKTMLLADLNEKYQIREAFHITRVMLPCGVVSLLMKLSASSFAWIYGLKLFDTQYSFAISTGIYMMIESTNCLICSILFLTIHKTMRRTAAKMICGRKAQIRPQSEAADRISNLHFDSLRSNWN